MTKQDDDKIKALKAENELLRIQVVSLEKLAALAQKKKKIINQYKAVVITVLRQELKYDPSSDENV
ncbi:hypothetical protein [Leuconostoc lactis]|uniref:hypothetical protein n=1 Tax=Leuconostoc lactis TaxID=1246 RepID=UPI001020FA7B|nr:hypothetical protein [Leuconostoc lactis]MSB66305.1 hypothetical protein [Leuconostoc lactis]